MSDDAGVILLLIAGTTFLGAIAKGATNLGLNLLAVPALAPLVGVPTAVLTIFVGKALSDIVMVWESRTHDALVESKRVWPFLLLGCGGAVAGTALLAHLDRQVLFLVLGGVILVFVGLDLSNRPISIPQSQERFWAPAAGLISGISQGLTGAAGPTIAIYMLSLRLTPREFVFLTSVIFVAINIGQLGGILYLGLYDTTRMLYAAAALVPIMLGTWVGIKMRYRLSVRGFRRAVLVLLAIMALNLLRLGVGSWGPA